jgi:hypothetical protein
MLNKAVQINTLKSISVFAKLMAIAVCFEIDGSILDFCEKVIVVAVLETSPPIIPAK